MKARKYTRKLIVENIHTGINTTVEIYNVSSMSKEAAEAAVKKTYGSSFKLIQIII